MRPTLRLGARGLVLGLVSGLLLCGCATRAPRPVAAMAEPALDAAQARRLIAAWQHELATYIQTTGHGDPAVLARLPAMRASGTLRAHRISFGVLDLEAQLAEADGFDVQGLLLADEAGADQVFMVGIVRRDGYRPMALVDLRPVTMRVDAGRIDWQVGYSEPLALARYRAGIDGSVPLRFPADQDDFDIVPCTPRQCVDERRTQARWTLPQPGVPARP